MRARLGRLTPYLYLAPMVGLVGVFLLYPAADTIWTSLTDSTGIGKAHFIGIDNYTALVHDPGVQDLVREHALLGRGSARAAGRARARAGTGPQQHGDGEGPEGRLLPAGGDLRRRHRRHLVLRLQPRPGAPQQLSAPVRTRRARAELAREPADEHVRDDRGVHVAGTWADDVALPYRPAEPCPASRSRPRSSTAPAVCVSSGT